MVTFEKHIHADTADDLIVKLPDEFLNKRLVIKAQEEWADTENDEFFTWLRSLGVKTKSWKFNRDEANER